jgi:nitric oxide reductase NorQ protein
MHPRPAGTATLPRHEGVRHPAREAPYYLPHGDEVAVFAACHARGLPVMLKGPTGCGKSRFVEHMACHRSSA